MKFIRLILLSVIMNGLFAHVPKRKKTKAKVLPKKKYDKKMIKNELIRSVKLDF